MGPSTEDSQLLRRENSIVKFKIDLNRVPVLVTSKTFFKTNFIIITNFTIYCFIYVYKHLRELKLF